MRIAVISDTHMPRGIRDLPERCWHELSSADAILHAGDWTAPEVLDALIVLRRPVHGIHGNCDGAGIRGRLPGALVVEFEGVRIGMIHDAGPAAGRLERLRDAFPDADAVVFGHTHMPQHETSDGFQIFNPGSPTERRRAPARSMGVANVVAGELDFALLALG